jgi:glyoxylase-like metal-dependent hydrolase (beta-lactamase superfamily II)
MKIEQIYTGCLAQGAYYITSNGEAAIDPLRETQPYLERLKKDGVQLKYTFETHYADFYQTHLSKKKTGVNYLRTKRRISNSFQPPKTIDFEVGNSKNKVLHTPGHAMESTTYTTDAAGKDQLASVTSIFKRHDPI